MVQSRVLHEAGLRQIGRIAFPLAANYALATHYQFEREFSDMMNRMGPQSRMQVVEFERQMPEAAGETRQSVHKSFGAALALSVAGLAALAPPALAQSAEEDAVSVQQTVIVIAPEY